MLESISPLNYRSGVVPRQNLDWEILPYELIELIFDQLKSFGTLRAVSLTSSRFSVFVRAYLPRGAAHYQYRHQTLLIYGITFGTPVMVPRGGGYDQDAEYVMLPSASFCFQDITTHHLERTNLIKNPDKNGKTVQKNLTSIDDATYRSLPPFKFFTFLQHLISNHLVFTTPDLLFYASELCDGNQLHQWMFKQIVLDLIAAGHFTSVIFFILKDETLLKDLMKNLLCSGRTPLWSEDNFTFYVFNGEFCWKSPLIRKELRGLEGLIKCSKIDILVDQRVENFALYLGHLLAIHDFSRVYRLLQNYDAELGAVLKTVSVYSYSEDPLLFTQCLKFSSYRRLSQEMRNQFLLGLVLVPQEKLQGNFLHRNLELLVRIDDKKLSLQGIQRLFDSLTVFNQCGAYSNLIAPQEHYFWLGCLIDEMQFPESHILVELYQCLCRKDGYSPWTFSSKSSPVMHPLAWKPFIKKLIDVHLKIIEMRPKSTFTFSIASLMRVWKSYDDYPVAQQLEPGSVAEIALRFCKEMENVRWIERQGKIKQALLQKGHLIPVAPPVDTRNFTDAELIKLFRETYTAFRLTEQWIGRVLDGPKRQL